MFIPETHAQAQGVSHLADKPEQGKPISKIDITLYLKSARANTLMLIGLLVNTQRGRPSELVICPINKTGKSKRALKRFGGRKKKLDRPPCPER